jgi:MoxR-like ATPase
MATQNPVEYEGTYPLPETQLDRFMMKIPVSYPPADAELDILKFYAEGVELQQLDSLIPSPVITREEVLARRRELASVRVKDDILVYIQRLTAETRDPMYTQLGASTRAAVALLKASRALAGLRGSDFVTPDEVKDAAGAVLRHRIILRPEALIEGLTPDFHLDTVLKKIPVPR